MFADDTSLFTIVKDIYESASILNNDLLLTTEWAFDWKMPNPDPTNPAQELIFSKKKKAQTHPIISRNNIQVEKAPYQKHLGIFLDEKLNFKQHVNIAILKMIKGISVIKKLRHSLPRQSLLTIYKAFLRRPLVDYGDIIYDQPQNESFCDKTEPVQYKAVLAITGAMQGTSRDKLNQELGLISLKARRWYKRLCCMYKIMAEKAPNYLINIMPKCDSTIKTTNNSISIFYCRTDCFKYSFFPSILNDWFSFEIQNQYHCSKVGCYLPFPRFKTTYILFLTQKA